MKPPCSRCEQTHARCTAHNRSGAPCRVPPAPGASVCWRHGGRIPRVAARAAVRAEVMAWGLEEVHVDPAETLMRLLAQSWRRVALYSDLLRQAYDGASPEALNEARLDALIGHKYDLDKDGNPVPVEEAIRGLVALEGQERDRCAKFAKLAIDAGIEERRVRLAEAQGAMLIAVLERVFDGLGLTAEQRQKIPSVVPAALRLVVSEEGEGS